MLNLFGNHVKRCSFQKMLNLTMLNVDDWIYYISVFGALYLSVTLDLFSFLVCDPSLIHLKLL